MPAFTARLTCVARVNFDHLNTTLSGLVCDKVIELSKRPSMQPTLCRNILVLFAASNLARLSDVLEVFQSDSCSWRGVLNDAFAEDVVTISVETRLTLTQFLEMTLSGFTSFRLQFSPNAEIFPVRLFPVLIAKELTFGGNSRPIQSKIYSDNFLSWQNIRLRNLYYHMQPVLSIAVNEVRCGYPIPLILCAELGYGKGNAHLATCSRKSSGLLLPIKRVRFLIVSNWTKFALGAFHGLELRNWITPLCGLFNFPGVRSFMFLLPSKTTCEGFSSFDTGLDKQVTYQPRTGRFGGAVRLMMQTHPILLLMLPTICAHLVECLRELRKRFIQDLCLFRSWVKLYSYCSVHTKSIPYMETFCQEVGFFSLRAVSFLPIPKGNGSPERTMMDTCQYFNVFHRA